MLSNLWTGVSLFGNKEIFKTKGSGKHNFLLFYSGNEKVFRKIESNHWGSKEDRRFKFEFCNLYAKCRVLDNIFYDWDNKVQIGAGDHQVNQKIIDNRKMAHTATSTIEISETNLKKFLKVCLLTLMKL